MTWVRVLVSAVVGLLLLTTGSALVTLSRAGTTVTVHPPDPVVSAAAVALPDPAPEPAGAPHLLPPEDAGRAALALIDYPIDRLGYRITFAGERRGLLGLTTTTSKTITIYVRPTQTPRELAKVVAHELGHALDVEATSNAERTTYRRIRGIGPRPWYPDCSGCTDYSSPAGDFAETFAQWLLGDVPFASTVAPRPTVEQLAALTPLFTL